MWGVLRVRRFTEWRVAGWAPAFVAALVVAKGAVVLMRPRTGVIEPAPVRASSYFSPEQLDRARDFRRPQRALGLTAMALEAGVLASLVRSSPRRLRGPHRRPVLAGAAGAAALSVALTAAPLPLSAIARERARRVGLDTQSWAGWLEDLAKSTAISAGLAGAGGALALGLMRRLPRTWWIAGSGAVVGVGAGFLFVGPVILDPIFNRFTKLPPGETRSDVHDLARRAGVSVGEVYEVDASRRTTAVNAYVTGLGASKRVVLYDNLLTHFSRDETRLVVAHELAHVHHRDVPRGLLYLAMVAPCGLLAIALLTQRLAPPEDRIGPAALPALVLSASLVSTPTNWIANGLSRRIEARADSFSLRLTGTPEPFVSFERNIALRNVAEPDPPRWVTALFGTHPSTVERIGIAKAYEQGAR